jgi:hypothetical protein
VLIVGCGCRGRELAAVLAAEGLPVRGTTRDEASLEAIEATGAQAALADPDRLATILPQLENVAVICWLMGTAVAEPEVVAAIHGPRLASLLQKLVDSQVRGFVYEAAGTVQPVWLQQGIEAVRAAERRRIPVELLEHDPADHEGWLRAAVAAVRRLLSSGG